MISNEEIESDGNDLDATESNKEPRVSCCYGFMVFLGLLLSLGGVTVVVVYAGFWSNYASSGNFLHHSLIGPKKVCVESGIMYIKLAEKGLKVILSSNHQQQNYFPK